jgi:hypothetical protein
MQRCIQCKGSNQLDRRSNFGSHSSGRLRVASRSDDARSAHSVRSGFISSLIASRPTRLLDRPPTGGDARNPISLRSRFIDPHRVALIRPSQPATRVRAGPSRNQSGFWLAGVFRTRTTSCLASPLKKGSKRNVITPLRRTSHVPGELAVTGGSTQLMASTRLESSILKPCP